MADTNETEGELIAQMQLDVAKVKNLLARIEDSAEQVAHINHESGRLVQAADAMIWQGAVASARGSIVAAHGVASKALIAGYDNGADLVARGPGR